MILLPSRKTCSPVVFPTSVNDTKLFHLFQSKPLYRLSLLSICKYCWLTLKYKQNLTNSYHSQSQAVITIHLHFLTPSMVPQVLPQHLEECLKMQIRSVDSSPHPPVVSFLLKLKSKVLMMICKALPDLAPLLSLSIVCFDDEVAGRTLRKVLVEALGSRCMSAYEVAQLHLPL